MTDDKRKSPKQILHFGDSIKDLTKHGSYSYLRYGSHVCKNCILRENDKCEIYGKTVEYNGQQIEVGMETECPIIQEHVQNIIEQIMALPHIESQDIILVQQLARAHGFIAIANKYLNEIGMFRVDKVKKTVDAQPLIDSIIRQEGLIKRLCNELALSPKARSILKVGNQNPALSKLIIQSKESDNED